MTRAERDKRYRETHATERAQKRKAAKAERSDERIQVDLARDCERKRLKKAEMSKEELAASRQRASELSKQRAVALSVEDREALLARGRATELRLRLAKKHGPKAFCMDRAARYPTDSVQRANYTQLAQQGFITLRDKQYVNSTFHKMVSFQMTPLVGLVLRRSKTGSRLQRE